MRKFPFIPKSTASLEAGDFWSIPLDGGEFGCGRVIELKPKEGTGSRSMLLVGLMNWIGNEPPTASSLSGVNTVIQREIHIRSIKETGPTITGNRLLAKEGIKPEKFLSQSPGGGCMLMHGYNYQRKATIQEQKELPVFGTWGYLVIKKQAEKLAKNAT